MVLTKEEVKAVFEDKGNEALFSTVAKTKGLKTPDEMKGLDDKNKELLKEKKEWQSKAKELEIKIQDFEDKVSDYDSLKGKKEASKEELDTLRKEKRDFERKFKTSEESAKGLQKELDTTTKSMHNSHRDRVLREQLDKINVMENVKSLVFEAHRGRATTETDTSGALHVYVKDEKGESVPIENFYKSWSAADENKDKIKALINKGGGSHGGEPGKNITATESGDLFSDGDFK